MSNPPSPSQDAWPSTNSELLQQRVYLGIWTNWSYGPVLGSTLTIRRSDGELLIAFTAFFIAFVGNRLWRTVSFFLHRCYTTPEPRDALHHQRQVILRNAGSPDTGVWKFAMLYWTSRGSAARGAVRRLLPAFLLALVCMVAVTVAGGFSSRISVSWNGDAEVLINGENCGYLGGMPDMEAYLQSRSYQRAAISNSFNYARQCYGSNASGILNCNTFVNKRLPGTVNTKAPCPFNNGICRSESSNLVLDSGYLDSNDHLGLNFPPDQRLLLRLKLQCAPLVTAGRSTRVFNETTNATHVRYDYGSYTLGFDDPPETLPYSFEMPDVDAQYGEQWGATKMSKNFYLTWSTFIFDPDLIQQNGDHYVFFLSGNGIRFIKPVTDPWYRATVPWGGATFSGQGRITTYRPEEAASPLACVDQLQICRASPRECGPLDSPHDAAAAAAPLFDYDLETDTASSEAGERFGWLYNGPLYYGFHAIDEIVDTLGPASLVSQEGFNGMNQGPLPDDQWQLDVARWWATQLAHLQSDVVGTAYGVSDPVITKYQTSPATKGARDMCNNQKIRSSNHASFSLFGLLFTYIVGILIALFSFTLEPIAAHLRKHRGYKQYSDLEWTTNGIMQLHRLAHEAVGGSDSRKDWSKCTDEIPTAKGNVMLAGLDLTDPEHPWLLQSQRVSTTLSSTSTVVSNGDNGSGKKDKDFVGCERGSCQNGNLAHESRNSVVSSISNDSGDDRDDSGNTRMSRDDDGRYSDGRISRSSGPVVEITSPAEHGESR